MSTAAFTVTVMLGLIAFLGILAGIVIYFRKSLGDQIIERYREVHEADATRIGQLEDELNRTKARVLVLEKENEALKGLAIGRDLLAIISEQIATSHKEVIEALERRI